MKLLLQIALLLVSACVFAGDARINDFIGTDSIYTAVKLDMSNGNGLSHGENFFPITKIVFDGKRLYLSTYGGELSESSYKIEHNELYISPIFLSPLTIGGELGEAAALVRPYAERNIVYLIKKSGDTSSVVVFICREINGSRSRIYLGKILFRRAKSKGQSH